MDLIDVPNEVLRLLAESDLETVRLLGGALDLIHARSILGGIPIDVGLAESVLSDLSANGRQMAVTPPTIAAVVGDYFATTVEVLRSPIKTRDTALVRQIAIYLCLIFTDASLVDLGQEFDRDHTVVMYAGRKIRVEMCRSRELLGHIRQLTVRIRTGSV
ncbi:helix-turn-helix domain-containing protein [Mycolicibacterium aubagnense]|nr:helix-turn-helix domain-containing protein [Mycolicibacterium aubagnense]